MCIQSIPIQTVTVIHSQPPTLSAIAISLGPDICAVERFSHALVQTSLSSGLSAYRELKNSDDKRQVELSSMLLNITISTKTKHGICLYVILDAIYRVLWRLSKN
jgi:hypothetical protein